MISNPLRLRKGKIDVIDKIIVNKVRYFDKNVVTNNENPMHIIVNQVRTKLVLLETRTILNKITKCFNKNYYKTQLFISMCFSQ